MRNQDIEGTAEFGERVDFGKTAGDYRRFRAGFPIGFFKRLVADGWVSSGQRALDLGTGTGTIARGLAELGMDVIAIDPAAEMMEQARMLDLRAGVSVDYREAQAEATGVSAESMDVVCAGQCWHWFDRSLAAKEAHRVLKRDGRMIIAHFDWIPLPGNVVQRTEELILSVNSEWTMGGGSGIYPQWFEDLAKASFHSIESFSFDLNQPYSPEAWRGRIRASAAIKACLDAEEVQDFDRRLAEVLEQEFPGDVLQIPHRVWAVSGVKE